MKGILSSHITPVDLANFVISCCTYLNQDQKLTKCCLIKSKVALRLLSVSCCMDFDFSYNSVAREIVFAIFPSNTTFRKEWGDDKSNIHNFLILTFTLQKKNEEADEICIEAVFTYRISMIMFSYAFQLLRPLNDYF